IPYCTYIFPPPISSREREPHIRSPTYLHRSHFSIYGPVVQMERLDIQLGWKSNFLLYPAPNLISFSHCRPVLAWSGAFVNAQPNFSTSGNAKAHSSLPPPVS
ncbi:hypothetical protein AVEN_34487-1, partial [Araneus ventricosus]